MFFPAVFTEATGDLCNSQGGNIGYPTRNVEFQSISSCSCGIFQKTSFIAYRHCIIGGWTGAL